MVDPVSRDDTPTQGTTVFSFPNRHVLSRDDAARYLGISAWRLRQLMFLRCGPVSFSPGRFRMEDLDLYRADLFEGAGISTAEIDRRRRQRYGGTPLDDLPADPFVEMATRNEIREVTTFVTGRAVIGLGLAIIVLSHTPLWHFLRTHL